MDLKKDLHDFEQSLKQITRDILSSEELKSNLKLRVWVKNVIKNTVPQGKKLRGLMVISSYKAFARSISDTQLKKSYILGWCVEIMQASFLIADDIMDFSQERRGQPCWYLKVGMNAINDAFFLENLVYLMLKKNFEGEMLAKLIDTFRNVTLKTIFGQTMDLNSSKEKSFDHYTMEEYSTMVKYKTSYYSFYLPIMLGIILSDFDMNDKMMGQIQSILFKLGFLFQVQDDFLDCFGDVQITGKVGTDIEESKLTWFIVKAMKKADNMQRTHLEKYFWKGMDATKDEIKMVKKIYSELELDKDFENFEENESKSIEKMIENLENTNVQNLLSQILRLINKRKK